MKKMFLFSILAGLFIACEGEAVYNPTNPCADWQIQVSTTQKIRLLDNHGERIKNIDKDSLSLISTDENWNQLFTEDGIPIKDLGGIIGVTPYYLNDGNIDYLAVDLGQVKIEDKCYFLLRINETTYYQIKADYNIDCGNMILIKFNFNGIEYSANDLDIIDVSIN